MANLLNIETATPLCSVVLSHDGNCIALRETLEEKSHASRLTVFIEEVLRETGMSFREIDAVAVGKGPGSYTGLRIGVSTAKGLCFGSNLPLLAVGTLEVLFRQALIEIQANHLEVDRNALLCPMIDARRMEVFTCLFTPDGLEEEPASAKIIDTATFSGALDEREVWFFGSGMEKCHEILGHPNARFLTGIHPHAAALAIAAEERYQRQQFEDLAYFEPFYLKDFMATISKKSLML